MRFYKLLSEFLACHLPRVSRQSRLWNNSKGDNKVKPGLFTSLLSYTLQLRKFPKTLVKRSSDGGCATSYHSYLQTPWYYRRAHQ